jgi:hypothetical protein
MTKLRALLPIFLMTPLILRCRPIMNMPQEIETAVLTRDEYQAVANQLDSLWSRPTTPAERLEIERLLRLIEPCDATAVK